MKIQNVRTPLTAGTLLQEFEVREVLGSGGFGLVYNAYDTKLQREIALKEYFPAGIAVRGENETIVAQSPRDLLTYSAGLSGFLYEARALAQFKHPALAEIWRFWEQNGSAYIVMPKYFGNTMHACIEKSHDSCTEPWLRHILMGALSALEVLHSKNLFHRDISPENIFILANGDPVLLDLGATREATVHDSEALTITLKYGYAPIEQYSNDPQIMRQGPWTDIYALCASAYFAITRRPPPTAVGRLINDTLEPLDIQRYPQFSPNFLSALRAGMQIRPEHRPQSAAALLDALKRRAAIAAASAPLDAPALKAEIAELPTEQKPPADVVLPVIPPAERLTLAPQLSAADKVLPPPRRELRHDAEPKTDAKPVKPVEATREAVVAPLRTLPPPTRKWWLSAMAAVLLLLFAALLYARLGSIAIQKDSSAAEQSPITEAGTAAPVVNIVVPATPAGMTAASGTAAADAVPLQQTPTTVEGTVAPTPTVNIQAVPAAPPAETTAEVAVPKLPPPERGTLVVNILPWGNIAVDGRDRGVSPPLKRLQLPPGRYVVTISSPGFENYNRTIDLANEQTVEISYTFQ